MTDSVRKTPILAHFPQDSRNVVKPLSTSEKMIVASNIASVSAWGESVRHVPGKATFSEVQQHNFVFSAEVNSPGLSFLYVENTKNYTLPHPVHPLT